jgi:hypothetical protein
MRNLAEQPITHGEILEYLNAILEDVSFEKTQLFGDMRPLLLERAKQMVLDDLTRQDRAKLENKDTVTVSTYKKYDTYPSIPITNYDFKSDEADLLNVYVVNSLKEGYKVLVDGKEAVLRENNPWGWWWATDVKAESWDVTSLSEDWPARAETKSFNLHQVGAMNAHIIDQLEKGCVVFVDNRPVKLNGGSLTWSFIDTIEKKAVAHPPVKWSVRRADSKTTRNFTEDQETEMNDHVMFCLKYTKVFVNDREVGVVLKQNSSWRYLDESWPS